MAALLLQLFMGWIWSWLVSVERVPVISVSFGTGLEKDVCDVLSLTLLAEMSLLTTSQPSSLPVVVLRSPQST